MSAAAATVAADLVPPGGPGGGYRVPGFADTLRSEWTKARTVPSTLWTLAAAVVLGVGLGALISALSSRQYAKGLADVRRLWDPTSISGSGLAIAQLAIGVLGVLIVTSEYSTGAIRSGLTAVPRRGRFLAAKAAVVAALTFVTVQVTAFAAFFLGQALISGHAPTAGLGQSGVLRALVGCGLDGALIGLFGLALGALVRNAAGAISVLVAVFFVLPAIAQALPASVRNPVEEFWPTQAGQQVTEVVRQAHTLSPWAGFAVMCLFVAIVLSAAFLVLDRRDA
ncbi:MAG TPA: ABC transporter permease subunit [Actinocrinis sp.]|nr:ABC transporter permease subunit [Actinocrinis sp.]